MDLHEIMSNRGQLKQQLQTQEGLDEFVQKLSAQIEQNVTNRLTSRATQSAELEARREKLSAAADVKLSAIYEAGYIHGLKESGALSDEALEVYPHLMQKAAEVYKQSMDEMVEGAEAAEDLTSAEIDAAAQDLVGGDGEMAAEMLGSVGDDMTADEAKAVLEELVEAADEGAGEKTSSDRAEDYALIEKWSSAVSPFTFAVYNRAVAYRQILDQQ